MRGGQAGAPTGAPEAEGHQWDPCGTSWGGTSSTSLGKSPREVWPRSCPAWCTMAPHHSHPLARLGAVGCMLPGWGEGRVVARSRMGGCGDSNHHQPAWGGCLAVGTHHRGVWRACHGRRHHAGMAHCGRHIRMVSCGYGRSVPLVRWPWLSCHRARGAGTGRGEVKRREAQ